MTEWTRDYVETLIEIGAAVRTEADAARILGVPEANIHEKMKELAPRIARILYEIIERLKNAQGCVEGKHRDLTFAVFQNEVFLPLSYGDRSVYMIGKFGMTTMPSTAVH